MKKNVMVVALMLMSGSLLAEVRPFVGGNVGALGGNDELNTSIIGGGQIGINGDYLGASMNLLYYNKGNKDATLTEGSFSMVPLMFNFFGRIPLKNQSKQEVSALRLGGGFSYVTVNHEIGDNLTNALNRLGYSGKEEVSNGLGYQVNGGIDFNITDNISIGADIIYLFFKPELKATLTNNRTGRSASATTDVKLDTVIGMVCAKYHF